MKYLLDTNPCIRYLNGRSDHLRDRIDSVGDEQIVICSVVRAELFCGAAKSVWPDKTLTLQRHFLDRFPSLAFDDMAAQVYGPVRALLEKSGMMIGAHDLLIASIALARRLILVTHNSDEFRRIPDLRLEDWESS